MSWLTFEPQIQGIWQRTSFDDTLDPFSTTSFDHSNVFTGRVGALLRGTFGSTGAVWQPYLKGKGVSKCQGKWPDQTPTKRSGYPRNW